MKNGKSRGSNHVYRFALYGVRASGKTCILAAMGMARRANPKRYSCTWIEEVPDHPLPAGDPSEWKSDDPYHRGCQWLREARSRIEEGDVPPQTPRRAGLMRLRFKFAAPDHGGFWVDLTDYSGELITSTSGELAAQLRRHMQSCDGILLLAEVPRPGQSHAPWSRDFEQLKEAFSILLSERDASPELDWPVALLLNKWDRRGALDFENPDSEDAKLEAFLESDPDLPHPSLINAVKPVVRPENLGIFPVSAFGMHKILPDGREVPERNGSRLQSFRLEDPFVWLVDRKDKLDVREYEASASRCSWWKFWQLFIGCSPLRMATRAARVRDSLWRRMRGVSPLRSLVSGIQLSGRLPERCDLATQVKRGIARSGYRVASQFLIFVMTLLLALLVIETGTDGFRYRKITTTLNDPEASKDALNSAETWLEGYYASGCCHHSLSRWLVLDRETARKMLEDSQKKRDDRAYRLVDDAKDEVTRLAFANAYLEEFPNGRHASDARQLVAQAETRRKVQDTRSYIQNINLQCETEIIDNQPEEKLRTTQDNFRGLLTQVATLPHPEAIPDTIDAEQKVVRNLLSSRLEKIRDQIKKDQWRRFSSSYHDLMIARKVREAGHKLSKWDAKDLRLKELAQDFATHAVPIIQEQSRSYSNNRQWGQARKIVNEVASDPACTSPLGPTGLLRLRAIRDEVDKSEDKDIYDQILGSKPSCRDQITAYLKLSPPGRMKKHVDEYQAWLVQKAGILELKLVLSQVDWGDADNNYRHDAHVTVDSTGKIDGSVVAVSHGQTGSVGEPLTLHKRLTDPINVNVKLVREGYWPWEGDKDAGSADYPGTVEGLNGKPIVLPCSAQSKANQVSFTLSGIPGEPNLPKWGEE